MRAVNGAAESSSESGPRIVLVADDNADAADTLALLLRTVGYTVHVAHGGAAALDLAAQLRPDVAVLDIGMPGLNGFEVARWFRNQTWGERTRLVALTAWGSESTGRDAQEAGFDVRVVKPADLHEIVEAFTK